jgi:hypothetical protein
LEVEKHRAADQIISGTYGKTGEAGKWQGCAVGCSIRSYNNLYDDHQNTSNHALYERLFGVPAVLARLEDRIFEGLPKELKSEWPGKFFAAIKPGADLSTVWSKFAVWLLVDAEHGVIRHATSAEAKTAIERVAGLYRTGGTKEQFKEARASAAYASAVASASADAAYAAVSAAAAAAADAAYAAYAADAADAAAVSAASAASAAAYAAAADAAADAAAYAAYADAAAYAAADAAAYAAADAAAYAAAADAAASVAVADAAYAARQKAFNSQAEKLLQLLAEAEKVLLQ